MPNEAAFLINRQFICNVKIPGDGAAERSREAAPRNGIRALSKDGPGLGLALHLYIRLQ